MQISARDIVESAIRLDNDINGNPRYYVPCFMFMADGVMYRPEFALQYRGKRYGAGWVFTSYSLEETIQHALDLAIASRQR